MSLLQDSPSLGCGSGGVWGTRRGVWLGHNAGFSLVLQAKRKLDLEGPEFRTPKGKGWALAQVPSPRSK